MVKAYQLENQNHLPVIIIDNSLISDISKILKDKRYGKLLKRENDIYYIDYLEALTLSVSDISKSNCLWAHKELIMTNLDYFSNKNNLFMYEDELKKAKKIMDKYLWLSKYHNDFCEKHQLNEYSFDVSFNN